MKQSQVKRFLLVSIIPQRVSDEEVLNELQELKQLVESFDGSVVEVVVQRREVHDKGMYIGEGKIKETATLIKENKVDTMVLNAVVKPGHLYDIKTLVRPENPEIEVWDRADLILHIFSRHAKTAESRLQIELAAMHHMGPRIYGMGMVLSRQTGGIGGRGIGETNTERMKRHWRDQMKKTEEKLEKLAIDRQRQLARRQKNDVKTVSIIGYTNAGKTSLFNLLTGKKKYAKDELFATLDSVTGKLYLPNLKEEVLISDTIGFIQKLPTQLINAFKSTLMESIHADLLLHVIDSSDPHREKKISVVHDILRQLGIADKPQLYVFSKTDKISREERDDLAFLYQQYSPLFISIQEGATQQAVKRTIETTFLSDGMYPVHYEH